MANLTRRSLLRGSLGAVVAARLARPHLANAEATTATIWVVQGFIPEEDAAFRAMVANYEKASGNKIDYSIVPLVALRQKDVSAITSGVVPDMMGAADYSFVYLNAWNDRLLDVTDVFETQKSHYSENAHQCSFAYNNVTKRRGYYQVPWISFACPFHVWKSLIVKAGYKVEQIPKTWDAFLDFFKPVQDNLRKQGVRNIYAYGYQLTANGVDPINTFNAFLVAYGGQDLVTADGKFHGKDPKVREAAIRALTRLTDAHKGGYVPSVVANWNDADDNNAFHAKLIAMDFDGTISTEVALYHDKAEYDDILTLGIPLSNEGKALPAQVASGGVVIPKEAKNITLAKEFLKYSIEPKVRNQVLKAGLGRFAPPMPSLAKMDPFWLDPSDQHRSAYVQETLFSPTIPIYEAYNPAMAQVGAEHVFMTAAFDVMTRGMKPQEAIGNAFARIEAVFANYPIVQA
jgi:multiple sugar transport system substrate-binding protein